MWKWLVLLAVAGTSLAYDHELYHNCSVVPLCSDNRGTERQERYQVLIEGAHFVQGVASFRVQNLENTDEFSTLSISAVRGNIFRVELEEVDSRRYHIDPEFVLDGEPELTEFNDVQLALDSATIISGDNKVIVRFAPLSVEFYSGDLLQLVLEGDRLTLQTLGDAKPFTFGLNFPSASRLYGLHEHADNFALRTTEVDGYDPYRVRTMDLTYYELYDTQAMYGAIPVLYGHGVGSTSGVFLHNAAELWVEVTNKDEGGPDAFWMVDTGAFDLFVFLGPSPAEAARQYVSVTGVPHLPPVWSLGYHQCRWGYWDMTDLQSTVALLDAGDFPIDAIWLDIQHTDNDKFFTWNPENFSTPFDMMANLSASNRFLVTLTDPHFKVEDGYFVYDEALAQDLLVLNPDGSVYESVCWPGISVWMDYLNPAAREYYANLYQYESWNGTTPTLGGIWNDMNEAAIFNEDLPYEKTFPPDVLHYGGVANREIHSIYGHLQVMSTHAGLMKRDQGTRRPFILTRAHFAGTQRFAAIWTGDNTAEWGFIPMSFAMCLNSAIVGISFCGADMGGFWGDPTDELLQRFFQSGAWLPFFREHSGTESARREPYLFSEEVQAVLRTAMRTRYAHLPVWYTLFYEHVRNGDPVIRPLWYHYPDDSELFAIDDQLLAGRDILVKVVAESEPTSVQMYFPGGEDVIWYSITDDSWYPGTGLTEVPVTLERIPVYYRSTSVVPLKLTPRPTTTDMIDDPYTFYVFLDNDFRASGTLYIDDNVSFEYQDLDKYYYVQLIASDTSLEFSTIGESDNSDFEIIIDNIIVYGPPTLKDGTAKYDKVVYDRTIDGTPLSQIKISGKEPITVKFA